eukprot:jgi/Chrpa1/14287/Chrysochromulina_OHIO_Genome00018030-RA
MVVEDPPGRGPQVRAFSKAPDDRAVQGGYSRRGCYELGSHRADEIRTELTKFGPSSARDQVCQDVGVAIEMRDSKAPVQGTPFRGGDEVLVGFNDDGVREDTQPAFQLTSHQLVASDDTRGPLLRCATGAVRTVEPVHDVSPPKVDGAEMLKQPAQSPVDMKLHPAAERLTNGGAGAQDLVPRDDDQAKDGDKEHADPLAPAFEAIHLRDHGLESERKGREVRHEHELELDVSISAGAEEQMGNERLIWVVSEAALNLCPVDNLEWRHAPNCHALNCTQLSERVEAHDRRARARQKVTPKTAPVTASAKDDAQDGAQDGAMHEQGRRLSIKSKLRRMVRTRGLGMYGAQLQSNVTVQSESLEDCQLRMMLIRRYDQANLFVSTHRAASRAPGWERRKRLPVSPGRRKRSAVLAGDAAGASTEDRLYKAAL